jgi:hypothetical protein
MLVAPWLGQFKPPSSKHFKRRCGSTLQPEIYRAGCPGKAGVNIGPMPGWGMRTMPRPVSRRRKNDLLRSFLFTRHGISLTRGITRLLSGAAARGTCGQIAVPTRVYLHARCQRPLKLLSLALTRDRFPGRHGAPAAERGGSEVGCRDAVAATAAGRRGTPKAQYSPLVIPPSTARETPVT